MTDAITKYLCSKCLFELKKDFQITEDKLKDNVCYQGHPLEVDQLTQGCFYEYPVKKIKEKDPVEIAKEEKRKELGLDEEGLS